MSVNLYCHTPRPLRREIQLYQTPDSVTWKCLAAGDWKKTLEAYLAWVYGMAQEVLESMRAEYRASNRGRDMPEWLEAEEVERYTSHEKELREAAAQYGHLEWSYG